MPQGVDCDPTTASCADEDKWSMTYDADGRPEILQSFGQTVEFDISYNETAGGETVNGTGLLDQVNQPRGVTNFEYDDQGRLISRIGPHGRTSEISYQGSMPVSERLTGQFRIADPVSGAPLWEANWWWSHSLDLTFDNLLNLSHVSLTGTIPAFPTASNTMTTGSSWRFTPTVAAGPAFQP